jgi:predicted RNA methylase
MARAKKIEQSALEVLSGLSIEAGPPWQVRIVTQLDRKLYTQVNEVLVALGGAWNRKAGAHVFDEDPQEGLDNVITTGEVVRAADLGFFATPPKLAAELVELAEVKPGMSVLEPSAGEGAIVEALANVQASITAVEIDAKRALCLKQKGLSDCGVVAMNFMKCTFDRQARVVMNPPFCKVNGHDHLDHVQHAYAQLAKGGILVSVLPASVLFRQDKRYREFRDWYEGLEAWVSPLKEGSFKSSGTNVNTVVLKMRRPG